MADRALAPGLALYRALLAAAPKVALPAEIRQGFGAHNNPIGTFVRRAFRRNRADTSPRLVYPALQAGYRILTMLARAAAAFPAAAAAAEAPTTASSTSSSTPSPGTNAPARAPSGCPEYDSLLAFLHARLAERNASFAAKALHPPNSRTPSKAPPKRHPDAPPALLVNVTPAPTPENPKPKPVYAIPSRPRPLSELGGLGHRRVPHMDMASDLAFMRVKKPQPASLSRILTQKTNKRADRMTLLQNFQEDLVDDMREEDEWETALAEQRRREGVDDPELVKSNATYRGTFNRHGIEYLMDKLTEEREDAVARADAIRALISQERALAESEKAERERASKERWVTRVKEQREERIRRREARLAREGVEVASETPTLEMKPTPEKPTPEAKATGQSRKNVVEIGSEDAGAVPRPPTPEQRTLVRRVNTTETKPVPKKKWTPAKATRQSGKKVAEMGGETVKRKPGVRRVVR